ncbi:hypothetical protein REPUB_Repub05bG0062800 [Reevesia pubescens]
MGSHVPCHGLSPKGTYYYKPKLQQDENLGKTLVHDLKTSLSQTLDYFFPLAGRLENIELEDEACYFSIDCNNAGVLFVHAAAIKITISDIIGPNDVPSFVRSFFQFNEVKNYKGTSNPYLRYKSLSFQMESSLAALTIMC